MSAAQPGSACEKSVAQSKTGPVIASLRVPVCCSSRCSRSSWLKRSSMLMSGLLENEDRRLGAVGGGQACPLLLVGWDYAVAESLAVALVVRAEQLGGEVVAAAMALAAVGINVHFHVAPPPALVLSA